MNFCSGEKRWWNFTDSNWLRLETIVSEICQSLCFQFYSFRVISNTTRSRNKRCGTVPATRQYLREMSKANIATKLDFLKCFQQPFEKSDVGCFILCCSKYIFILLISLMGQFLRDLRKRIEKSTRDHLKTRHIFQRILVVVQRGNAISFSGYFLE